MNIRNLCAFAFINLLLWCLAALCYFQTGGFFTDGYGLTFTALFIPGHILLFALGLFLLSLPARLIGPRALQAACVGWGDFSPYSSPWTFSSIPNTVFI